MFGISGFKTRKPRQFSYRPRSFDPEQEERDIRNAARESKTNSENYKPGSLVRNMRMERYAPKSHNDKRQAIENRNRMVIRLSIFLFFLLLVGFIIVNSTLLENIFSVFIGK